MPLYGTFTYHEHSYKQTQMNKEIKHILLTKMYNFNSVPVLHVLTNVSNFKDKDTKLLAFVYSLDKQIREYAVRKKSNFWVFCSTVLFFCVEFHQICLGASKLST